MQSQKIFVFTRNLNQCWIPLKGFTLVELLIVVTIIGTLATIGTMAYKNMVGKARRAEVIHYFGSLSQMVTALNSEGDDKLNRVGFMNEVELNDFAPMTEGEHHYRYNLHLYNGLPFGVPLLAAVSKYGSTETRDEIMGYLGQETIICYDGITNSVISPAHWESVTLKYGNLLGQNLGAGSFRVGIFAPIGAQCPGGNVEVQ